MFRTGRNASRSYVGRVGNELGTQVVGTAVPEQVGEIMTIVIAGVILGVGVLLWAVCATHPPANPNSEWWDEDE